MIDEKKLIEILSKNSIFEKITNAEGKNIFEIINDMPKTDWIPCEVELPPKPRFSEDSYLVKTQCVATPYTAYWNGEKWTDVLDDDIEDVIAWCQIPPYPQPYKKEGAE